MKLLEEGSEEERMESIASVQLIFAWRYALKSLEKFVKQRKNVRNNTTEDYIAKIEAAMRLKYTFIFFREE